MKKLIFLTLILLSMIKVFSQELFVLNSHSETISHVNIGTMAVSNSFAQVGIWANQVLYHKDLIYVVNSAEDNIQIINSAGITQSHIYLDNSSNPYQMLIHEDYIYVTGWAVGKLYKINLETHSYESIEIGIAPQSMLVIGGLMYVSLSGYTSSGYESGKIAIMDISNFTLVGNIDVYTNPQEMIVHNDMIHVICSGNYANETSKVAIVNRHQRIIEHTIELEWSVFTSMQKGADGYVYIGSGYGLGFASYSPDTYEIYNDSTNIAFPEGLSLLYDDNNIYVLAPDWFFNSKLRVYNHNHDLISELTLGIGSVSMCLKSDYLNLSDITNESKISFIAYPNPFVSTINFSINNSNAQIEIFNIKGQKVAIVDNMLWEGKDINGNMLGAGVYFAKVKNGDQVVVRRFVKL